MKLKLMIPALTAAVMLAGCAPKQPPGGEIPAETPLPEETLPPSETGTGEDEEISIDAGDHTIHGTYTAPAGEYDSAVILLHGYGADRQVGGMFRDFAEVLKTECNMASFRFDMQAVKQIADDGFTQYTLAEGSYDTTESLKWLKQTHPGIRHFYILGHSMGGTIAVINEAENAGMYDGIAVWAGAGDLRVLYTREQLEKARADGYYRMELTWKEYPIYIPAEWFEEMEVLDLTAVSARGKAPLLAVNGKLDDTVPYETGEQLTKVRSDERSMCIIYDEADHMFRDTREALYRDTAAYLNSLENEDE
jgi:fermentation-respiration switch protein FrsA (DUF1100 family)